MDNETRRLRKRAASMRNNPTDEEYKLWAFLKTYYPNFHRQKVIKPYIVDFCCPKLKLIIEVDGCQHYEDDNSKYDERRTVYLENKGYKVIRVTNGDIKDFLKDTLVYIDAICRERADDLNLDIKCGEKSDI